MLQGVADETGPEPSLAISDLSRSDRDGLVRMAVLLVDDQELGRDLVQEAFARLYRPGPPALAGQRVRLPSHDGRERCSLPTAPPSRHPPPATTARCRRRRCR
jgi:hypothetical protein